MDSQQRKTLSQPIPEASATGAHTDVSPASDNSKAAQAAGKYLNDSSMMNKLVDRVYELLLEDMRFQRERINNYGTQRWF
jgi:hypothetical protein